MPHTNRTPPASRKRPSSPTVSTSPMGTRSKKAKHIDRTDLDTSDVPYDLRSHVKPQFEERTTSPMTTRSKTSSKETSPGLQATASTMGGAAVVIISNQAPELAPIPSVKQLSAEQIQQTILRVSLSDKKAEEAPVSVPFESCQSSGSLFIQMLAECGLSADAASCVRKISARYTWSKKKHLIRRGSAYDWELFLRDVHRGWEKEGDNFMADGCEIEIYAHVD